MTIHMGWETFATLAPSVSEALRAISRAVDESGLEKNLTELMKLRASQINGCAFCTQYHLNLARKQDVSERQLGLVAVWRESGAFSARESAALAYTEHLTRAPYQPIDSQLRMQLEQNFSAQEFLFLTIVIANINAWNRIAGALRFTPA